MKFIIEIPIEIGWFFLLNPMRGRTEECRQFGPYETKEIAIDYYNSMKVETYRENGDSPWGGDTVWRKNFAKGSEFEWMNPLHPSEFNISGPFGHGLIENTRVIGPEISRRPL